MSNFKEEVNTVIDEVIEHSETILGLIKASDKAMTDAIEALKDVVKSKDPDDASSAVAFLEDAELLVKAIGAHFSPKIETLADTVDSVRFQLDLKDF
jgi:hypothetical protein